MKSDKHTKNIGSGESINGGGDSSQATVDFPGNKFLNKFAQYNQGEKSADIANPVQGNPFSINMDNYEAETFQSQVFGMDPKNKSQQHSLISSQN